MTKKTMNEYKSTQNGSCKMFKAFTIFFILFLSDCFAAKGEDYENYAGKDYKGYPRKGTDVYDWFDHFGDKVITGFNVYTFQDITARGLLYPGEALIFKSYRYNRWLNELIVISETIDGVKNAVIIGDEVKTKFSSFTLDKTDLNAIRWDLSSNVVDFSIVNSRLSHPVVLLNTAWQEIPDYYVYEDNPMYLLGIHNVFKIKKQNVSLTLLNARVDSNVWDQVSLFGYGTGITGLGIYGIGLSGEISKLKYRAEYNVSEEYINGKRSEKLYPAYYIRLEYPLWEGLTIGGNYHYVDTNYTTTFRPTGRKFKYYYTGELDRFEFVDDNDDADQYSDTIDQMPWAEYLRRRYEFFTWPDGVFPGLDKNRNGVSDYNENRNAFPDYEEDFLLFYVDPPEFEIGDDDNNNGIIDVFENDALPDYDYLIDHVGYGLWLKYDFSPALSLKLHRSDENLISNRKKNSTFNELILKYTTQLPQFAQINTQYRIKLVQDIIPNDTYEYSVTHDEKRRPLATYTLLEDKLLFKDSILNTIFADINYNRFLNLDIGTKIKYELNKQEVNSPQNKTTSFAGIVNRIRYEVKPFPKLSLSPMAKSYLGLKYGVVQDHYLKNVLIFKADYSFTKKTTLTFATQYLTLRNLLFTERPHPHNYDKNTFLLQLINKSRYLKYDIALVCGISRQIFIDVVPTRKELDTIDTLFFYVYIGG